MWFGLTIARSSPASTQWWRKTEFSTARAGGETPKETFETPSEVFTPGSSALMRRIPSIVSIADGFHSSSPVVRVKVSASKMSVSRSRPCSSQARPTMRFATSSLRSAVLAIPCSSIVSAITAAPCAVARGTTVSSLSRPASRLIELTIARPGICSSAAWTTSGSVESTWMGAGCHLVLGHLHETVVVVGEEQLLGPPGALRVDALADESRARLLRQRRGGHHRRGERLARLRPRTCLAAADSIHDRADVVGGRAAAAAHDRDAVALDEVLECARQGVGLLGEDRLAVRSLERQAGVRDAVDRERALLAEVADGVAHVLGAGGAVQADHVDVERGERGQHRLDVGPEEHLPAVREERDACLDRQAATGELERLAGAEDRGLDLEDVLGGLDEPLRLLGENLDKLAESDLAERGVVRRRQVPGGADRAGYESALAGGLAGDLRRPSVDLQRVISEPPLPELQPARLEGVGLDHLGARLEHRLVDALDHVGTVQDKRLVALSGQPAVVFGGQVELLERGAHAAVEDDDPLAGGLEEVAHDRRNASEP